MQCKALLKNGDQCPNEARAGSPFCYEHEDYDSKKQLGGNTTLKKQCCPQSKNCKKQRK